MGAPGVDSIVIIYSVTYEKYGSDYAALKLVKVPDEGGDSELGRLYILEVSLINQYSDLICGSSLVQWIRGVSSRAMFFPNLLGAVHTKTSTYQ